MFKKALELIEEYRKIVLATHASPDYDAHGSQIGLYLSLKERFPEKDIYLDGENNQNNLFGISKDIISKEILKDSLYIITDTACKNMLPNDNYKYADKVIIFDHHENDPDINGLYIIKKDYSSASELIAEFIIKSNMPLNKLCASYLYSGIIGDSNRFLYKGTTSNTFEICSKLITFKVDIFEIYNLLKKEETAEIKRIKGYVLSNFKVLGKVAYIYISNNTICAYKVTIEDATRGCVDLLSDIIGTDSYVIFAESENNLVYCEMRSKTKSIVEIAKKYGGGGHALACGAKIDKEFDYLKIIKEINEVL